FGVVVIRPRARSSGPKHPMPTASTPPASRKNETTRPIVSVGVVVGNVDTDRSGGPVPTAHTHFVPPASTPPTLGSLTQRAASRRARNSALTALPSAFPLVAFMTGPTNAPATLSSPATYFSHAVWSAAMAASTAASSTPVSMASNPLAAAMAAGSASPPAATTSASTALACVAVSAPPTPTPLSPPNPPPTPPPPPAPPPPP